mgnify:CR=1 FL=1
MKYAHMFRKKLTKDGLGLLYQGLQVKLSHIIQVIEAKKVAKNLKKEYLKNIKIPLVIVIYGQVIRLYFLKIIYLHQKEAEKPVILKGLTIQFVKNLLDIREKLWLFQKVIIGTIL